MKFSVKEFSQLKFILIILVCALIGIYWTFQQDRPCENKIIVEHQISSKCLQQILEQKNISEKCKKCIDVQQQVREKCEKCLSGKIQLMEKCEKSGPIQGKVVEKCEKRFPKAILVGAPKSGTSALLNFLNFHPQIAAVVPNEPRFFSTHYNNKSMEWYRNLMPCSTLDQITMEKSPGYFYGNVTASHIKHLNEKMKILIILKDPVIATVSMYAMWKANNAPIAKGIESFEEMVTISDSNNKTVVNPNSFPVNHCTYILHLPTWLEMFGKDQVFIIDGNQFEENPAQALQQAEKFLNITQFFTQEQFVFDKTKNKYCFRNEEGSVECLHKGKGRKHPDISEDLLSMLSDYYKPFNDKLSKLLNRKFTWMK